MPYEVPYEQWMKSQGANPYASEKDMWKLWWKNNNDQYGKQQDDGYGALTGGWKDDKEGGVWVDHWGQEYAAPALTKEEQDALQDFVTWQKATHKKTGLSKVFGAIGGWKAPLLALGGVAAAKALAGAGAIGAAKGGAAAATKAAAGAAGTKGAAAGALAGTKAGAAAKLAGVAGSKLPVTQVGNLALPALKGSSAVTSLAGAGKTAVGNLVLPTMKGMPGITSLVGPGSKAVGNFVLPSLKGVPANVQSLMAKYGPDALKSLGKKGVEQVLKQAGEDQPGLSDRIMDGIKNMDATDWAKLGAAAAGLGGVGLGLQGPGDATMQPWEYDWGDAPSMEAVTMHGLPQMQAEHIPKGWTPPAVTPQAPAPTRYEEGGPMFQDTMMRQNQGGGPGAAMAAKNTNPNTQQQRQDSLRRLSGGAWDTRRPDTAQMRKGVQASSFHNTMMPGGQGGVQTRQPAPQMGRYSMPSTPQAQQASQPVGEHQMQVARMGGEFVPGGQHQMQRANMGGEYVPQGQHQFGQMGGQEAYFQGQQRRGVNQASRLAGVQGNIAGQHVQDMQGYSPLHYQAMGMERTVDPDTGQVSFGLTAEGQARRGRASELSQLYDQRAMAAARGDLPISPAMERNLKRQEQVLNERLQRQLGSDYANSSVGIRALGQNSSDAEMVRETMRQQMLAEAEGLAQGRGQFNRDQQMQDFQAIAAPHLSAQQSIMPAAQLAGQSAQLAGQAAQPHWQQRAQEFGAGQNRWGQQYQAGHQRNLAEFQADQQRYAQEFGAGQNRWNTRYTAGHQRNMADFNAQQQRYSQEFGAGQNRWGQQYQAGQARSMAEFQAEQQRYRDSYAAEQRRKEAEYAAARQDRMAEFEAAHQRHLAQFQAGNQRSLAGFSAQQGLAGGLISAAGAIGSAVLNRR